MAISPNGRTLHPMLDGAILEDKQAGLAADLRIYSVSVTKNSTSFAGDFLRYRMASAANALGDFIMINNREPLVRERDSQQGSQAAFKRIYLVVLRDRDRGGYVEKTLLVDLMKVANPRLLGPSSGVGVGHAFSFPYFTIEDVEILGPNRISVLNDNNYPAKGWPRHRSDGSQ